MIALAGISSFLGPGSRDCSPRGPARASRSRSPGSPCSCLPCAHRACARRSSEGLSSTRRCAIRSAGRRTRSRRCGSRDDDCRRPCDERDQPARAARSLRRGNRLGRDRRRLRRGGVLLHPDGLRLRPPGRPHREPAARRRHPARARDASRCSPSRATTPRRSSPSSWRARPSPPCFSHRRSPSRSSAPTTSASARGAMMGLLNLVWAAASFAGPPLAGALHDSAGREFAWIALTVLMVVAAPIGLRVSRNRRAGRTSVAAPPSS